MIPGIPNRPQCQQLSAYGLCQYQSGKTYWLYRQAAGHHGATAPKRPG